MPELRNLRTVKALAAECPGAFTEPALRWLIFKSAENGLNSALVRVGRKVLIDVEGFNAWLERQRTRGAQG
jgi:hypothetical protein